MPELTPEDRQRIYEEERVRTEARQHFAQPPSQTKSFVGSCCAGAFIGLMVLGIAIVCWRTLGAPSGLLPDNGSTYSDVVPGPMSSPSPTADYSTERLKMVSQNFNVEDDWCTVTGEVKNIGSEKIANVEALTTFYDGNHKVVKTAEAVIAYNPILVGQTSPWKVLTTNNPEIKSERTTFKKLLGGEIETQPEDAPAPKHGRHRRRH
jgi:hypothetical protein